MDDSAIEAELDLAALDLDPNAMGGSDESSSLASSQVTAFLEEHGIVVSPTTRTSHHAAAVVNLDKEEEDGAHFAIVGGGGGDPREEDVEESESEVPDSSTSHSSEQREADLEEAVLGTPDRRRISSDDKGLNRESKLADTPRSGISSLGLLSPQRRPSGAAAAANTSVSSSLPRASGNDDRQNTWELVNHLLKHEGYRAVGGEDPQHMVEVLKEVLRDYRERGEMIKAFTMERQRLNSDQRVVEDRLSGVERARGNLSTSLHTTESRVKELEEEVEDTRKSLGDRLKEARVKITNLTAQLKQSEHRVRVKDAQIQKMLTKFDALVQKEVKDKERERAAIRRLQQREPKGAEAKYMDMFGALNSARQRALEEVKVLKEEVRGLNDMMKEKDNYIMRKESGGTWRPSESAQEGRQELGGQGVQHLIETIRDLESSLRRATRHEQAMAKKAENLEEEKVELMVKVKHLEDEKTNLILELKSRPTMKMWKTSQKRIEDLERQLQKAVEDAREASDIRDLRKFMGVGELVRRDKQNFRLKLDRVDALPREVMKEVLKEVCRLLDLTDIADVAPAVEKMTRAMTAIPRLERFVKTICVYVSRKTKGEYHADGRPISQEEAYRRVTMEEAAEAVKSWWEEIEAYQQLRSLRSRLITRLSNRAADQQVEGEEGGSLAAYTRREGDAGGVDRIPANAMSDDQLLDAISNLIDFERQMMQSRQLQNEADALLAARPEILLHRVIQHFRYLFQVKSIDGLFPKMNELYLFSSEMENLTRVLKSMLGLPASSSTNTLLVSLQKVIRRVREEQQGGGSGENAAAAEEEGEEGMRGNDDTFMTLSESEGDLSPPSRGPGGGRGLVGVDMSE